jgi:hypothetical protein
MRKKKAVRITTFLLVVFGLASIAIGIFAYQMGLDNNPVMGNKRKLLTAIGSFLLLLPLIAPAVSRFEQRYKFTGQIQDLLDRLGNIPPSTWLKRVFNAQKKSRINTFLHRHTWIWAVSAVLLAVLTSTWYLTAGTFTRWTPYSTYYDRQADAFLAGQLSLLEQPPAEFAQLDDVYNWREREGIPYLWDASYYQGKYYLYWGAVPAVVAAGIKLIHPGTIEDQVLVLIFISGLAASMSALFYWLRKKYFPSVPGWTILLFTLTCIFCTPVFWLINRPDVYEASIASAQFFLMLGIYSIIRGMTADRVKLGWLLLAGIFMGLSVGSRSTYIIAVAFITVVVGVVLIRESKNFIAIFSYSFPLALIGAGLAWFNYARFGSILETGLSYQLTGDVLPDNLSQLFSLRYIIPNAYSSLIRPFQFISSRFPFVFTPFIRDNMWPNIIHRPPLYSSGEPVTGILLSIPFLWVLALPLVSVGKEALAWINEIPHKISSQDQSKFPTWLWILLIGAAILQTVATVSFIMTTMRYLADFAPLWILLAGIVCWNSHEKLTYRPGWRRMLLLLTLALCLVTIVFGLLTNFQNGDKRFQTNNPALFSALANFFTNK